MVVPDGENTKVYFVLSPGDYENLSLNMAEILRWNREVVWQLEYYRREASNNGNDGRGNSESSGGNSP